MKYEIRDWMNNLCFKGIRFDSFEDAWGYIFENDPMPEGEDENGFYDDYFVEEVKGDEK